MERAFADAYQAVRPRIKLRGHPRGAAPLAALRAHVRVERAVLDELTARPLRDWSGESDLALCCLLEPVREGAPLRYFIEAPRAPWQEMHEHRCTRL